MVCATPSIHPRICVSGALAAVNDGGVFARGDRQRRRRGRRGSTMPTPSWSATLAAAQGAPLSRPQIADCVVVGCDSMLALDGASLGKPRDAEDAVMRWKSMRGRVGVLTTGHCVIDPVGRAATGVAETTVRFGSPSDDEIAAYVATGEPLARRRRLHARRAQRTVHRRRRRRSGRSDRHLVAAVPLPARRDRRRRWWTYGPEDRAASRSTRLSCSRRWRA